MGLFTRKNRETKGYTKEELWNIATSNHSQTEQQLQNILQKENIFHFYMGIYRIVHASNSSCAFRISNNLRLACNHMKMFLKDASEDPENNICREIAEIIVQQDLTTIYNKEGAGAIFKKILISWQESADFFKSKADTKPAIKIISRYY